MAKVRKAKGLTQRKLSYLSGVHRVSIARYETGRVSPNVRVLEKLANVQASLLEEAIELWKEEELKKIKRDPSAYIKLEIDRDE